jgi:protein SCO1/2
MKKLLLLPLIALAISCGTPSEKTSEVAELPILGERYVDDNQDTVYHSIADFAFVNEKGNASGIRTV